MRKKEQGVTLVALAITIIILVIIAGASITAGISVSQSSKDGKLQSELQIVQHAVLEQYEKYKVTGNEDTLVGTSLTLEQAKAMLPSSGITMPTEADGYYTLTASDLASIGAEGAKDDAEYLVNYKTGMVYDVKNKTLSSGTPLYLQENLQAD